MAFTFLKIRRGERDAPPPDVVEYTDTAGKNKFALLVASASEIDGTGSDGLVVSEGAAIIPVTTTMQAAAVANGNGTVLDVEGYSTAILQILSSPAMSGGTTVNFEVLGPDGVTWAAISADQVGSTGTLLTSTTIDGFYRFNVAGFRSLRARISAYSAGTINIYGSVSPDVGVTRNLLNTEQYAPVAEDNVNGVIAVAQKPVAVSAYGWSVAVNFSAATKANIKATPGIIRSARVTNANAAVRFFQIHNKASAPSAADVPIISIPIPAGTAAVPGVIQVDAAMLTVFASLGLGWAISTTVGTFTDAATASEHTVTITYA